MMLFDSSASSSSSTSSSGTSDSSSEEESIINLPEEYSARTDNFTKSELSAISKLGRQGYLYYSYPIECCPDKELAKALNKQLIHNDEQRLSGEYPYDINEYLETKRGVNPDTMNDVAETKKLWNAAADEIRCHIGDDVLAGTLYPVSNNNNNNSSNDDDAASVPITSFTVTARGQQFQVPLAGDQPIRLYHAGSKSMFGQEGVGDVYDETVRRSIEIPADELQLPEFLQHPEKYFPEMTEQVTARLVPTSETVRFVPYKLVGYRPGDFFDHHRDTVYEEAHTGTLVIHLPCIGDYEEPTPGFKESPDFFSHKEDDDPNDIIIELANKSSYPDIGEPIPEECQIPNTRCVGGALRFFLGRDLVYDAKEYQNEDPMINEGGYYGKMWSNSDMMVACVRVQNYSNAELTVGQSALVPAHANIFAQPQDSDSRATFVEQRRNGESTAHAAAGRFGLEKPADRKFAPLHYACWTTSTIHDVRPLKSGYRFVMTYKVLREGKEVWRVPPVEGFNEKLTAFIESYDENCIKNHQFEPRDVPSRSIITRPNFPAFAFLCRHTYAPYTLTPAALRRIDATAYYALTARWGVVLTPVLVRRRAVQAVSFGLVNRGEGTTYVELFLTAEFHSDEKEVLERDWVAEKTDTELYARLPHIITAGCMELGFGSLFRRGISYGNGDCNASFYYRSAAMICTFKPSDWARRKVAFLIFEKSKDDSMNVMKKVSHLYPVFRNIVLFL